ncbi:ribosomal protein L1 [Jimgerdemannia flammicorona]|uniref:Ribosomal L1 domain-containing protein 1 n=1 Tax=Jimgerdemannia flammicorona TaxID=994334 RepID=A0A433QAF6_9FUNG|nr:ribosomal protein L1 [Jimgerdemannia flammicorona]
MLDDKQADRAIKALLKHVEKKKAQSKDKLIDDDQAVWLIVATKKFSELSKTKPCRIPLEHSLLPLDAEVCIFVKDPQKQHKDLLVQKKVKRIKKVIDVSKLRNNYKPFQAKRNLCDAYDLFLADDRVIRLLPRMLGKTFFKKKKQPIPVNMTRSNLQAEIARACESTYMHLSPGTSLPKYTHRIDLKLHLTSTRSAIKIGTTSQTPAQVFENLQTALPHIIDKIPSKWKNIQSLNLKTSDSVSLPIYNSLPDEQKMIKTKEEAIKYGMEADEMVVAEDK